MRKINVPTSKGFREETVYNVDDFPYDSFKIKKCKKRMGEDTLYYYNCSAAFDIESTTVVPPTDSNNKYIYAPYGFMYHWQFCLIDKVVFGRTWEEFVEFLDRIRDVLELDELNRLVVYVHNLAYEFQFMKDFLNIGSIFAKDKRKPIKVHAEGIEFRCSYSLSNRSLASFCENSHQCYHYKLEDEYDYNKMRTPETTLTPTEEAYCYNDVRGLCECIDTMLEEDTIASIPLTNTGYVRRDYRNAMKSKKLRAQFVKTALLPHQYKMLRRAFRGGNTHANRFKANKKLNKVYSFDISSSYPSSIMMDEFPVGKFTDVTIDSQAKLDYYCANFCVVMDVHFFDISLKEEVAIPYLDIAHCNERSNILNDNGRVLKADYVSVTLTNIDLDIIRSQYDYSEFYVSNAMYSERGKLPDELRHKMMEYYRDKTQLKDVEGREYDYMKSKNRLNSTFGMMVTDIAHQEVEYIQTLQEWTVTDNDLEEELEAFYKSRNNFLSYQWGVFVTANARKRLQDMLDKMGMDIVYIDTDSIKFENAEHIKEFEDMNKELERVAEENDIPAYCDRDGKRYYLGTWDNDGNYETFKTLGAKKYCYTKMKKGKEVFEVTVSGMSKKKGAIAVGSVDNFKIGTTYHDVGRTTSWYNDTQIGDITVDGATFTSASNIGIVESTYTLGVTNEYWELIYQN